MSHPHNIDIRTHSTVTLRREVSVKLSHSVFYLTESPENSLLNNDEFRIESDIYPEDPSRLLILLFLIRTNKFV